MPFDSILIEVKAIKDFHRHKETCLVLIVNCLPFLFVKQKMRYLHFSFFVQVLITRARKRTNVLLLCVIDYDVAWHKHKYCCVLHVEGIILKELT